MRHLQPAETIKRVFDAEHNSLSAAEDGKPCFSTIDDVFSQSALACGKLLDRMKATPARPASTDNGGESAAREIAIEKKEIEPEHLAVVRIIPQYFDITARTVYRWIKNGRLKEYPDVNGLIRVDMDEVAVYAKRRNKQ